MQGNSDRLNRLKDQIGQAAPAGEEQQYQHDGHRSPEPPQHQEVQRNQDRATIELPPRPPVKKRRNKKLRFTDIYTPITFYVDKRIAPSLRDYLEQGESNTALANQIFLKILLDAGYEIDPTILTKPPQ